MTTHQHRIFLILIKAVLLSNPITKEEGDLLNEYLSRYETPINPRQTGIITNIEENKDLERKLWVCNIPRRYAHGEAHQHRHTPCQVM